MDFPDRLRCALQGELSLVRDCNVSVEDTFLSLSVVKPEDVEAITEETLQTTSKVLCHSILKRLLPQAPEEDDRIREAAKQTVSEITEESAWLEDDGLMKELPELFRAVKNLLRWYIQIYLSVQPPKLPSPLLVLQSLEAVELYLTVLRRTSGSAAFQETARHACLALFYATYNPLPAAQEALEHVFTHLVESMNILQVCMTIMMENNTVSVLLSVVRLLHNLLNSVQGLSKNSMEERRVPPKDKAPWIKSDSTEVDIVTLLFWLVSWHIQAQPSFPGDAADRRSDFIVEILRVLYVLRGGCVLVNGDYRRQVIADILVLDSVDPRSHSCKLGCVTLLMDAPRGFGDFLMEQGREGTLLSVLEKQVSDVVRSSRSGNQVAAALVPSLVVLHNFSANSSDFLERVKEFIFPREAEDAFWAKAESEISRANGQGVGAKNMSPLDAPKGTLRWKLIRLMTWTESHTKRTTSELLWLLCDQNAKEFVLRTGFGNAMPMLGLKGFVDLPS